MLVLRKDTWPAARGAGIAEMKMAKCAAGRGGADRAVAEDISELQMLLHPELLSQDFIQLMLQEVRGSLADLTGRKRTI